MTVDWNNAPWYEEIRRAVVDAAGPDAAAEFDPAAESGYQLYAETWGEAWGQHAVRQAAKTITASKTALADPEVETARIVDRDSGASRGNYTEVVRAAYLRHADDVRQAWRERDAAFVTAHRDALAAAWPEGFAVAAASMGAGGGQAILHTDFGLIWNATAGFPGTAQIEPFTQATLAGDANGRPTSRQTMATAASVSPDPREMAVAYRAVHGTDVPWLTLKAWEAGQLTTATGSVRTTPWYLAATAAKRDGQPMSAVPRYMAAAGMDATAGRLRDHSDPLDPSDDARDTATALSDAATAMRAGDLNAARSAIGRARSTIRPGSALHRILDEHETPVINLASAGRNSGPAARPTIRGNRRPSRPVQYQARRRAR